MRTIASFHSTNNLSPASTPLPLRNSWHSPVPFLYGGLAAMLGLIACALLILVCSYWHLSRHGNGSSEHHGGDGKQADGEVKQPPCLGEGFVVIMPGDGKPTFVATPISSGKVTAADER